MDGVPHHIIDNHTYPSTQSRLPIHTFLTFLTFLTSHHYPYSTLHPHPKDASAKSPWLSISSFELRCLDYLRSTCLQSTYWIAMGRSSLRRTGKLMLHGSTRRRWVIILFAKINGGFRDFCFRCGDWLGGCHIQYIVQYRTYSTLLRTCHAWINRSASTVRSVLRMHSSGPSPSPSYLPSLVLLSYNRMGLQLMATEGGLVI